MEGPPTNPTLCSECKSPFFSSASPMEGLCAECASVIYGYTPCKHRFEKARCACCGWDGSRSDYVRSAIDRNRRG